MTTTINTTSIQSQQSIWMGILRIVLGLILFAKGILFISNTDALNEMMYKSAIEPLSFILVNYVAVAHLVGGLMIIFGLLTRWAVSFEIPVLLGAIIFIHRKTGFFSIHSELFLSILVLILLVIFLIYGSGPFSVDKFMRKNKSN
jgi:putative oxidoreductase